MPTWQPTAHLFEGIGPTDPWPTVAVPVPSPGFDGLTYDCVNNTNYPNALFADGTGRVRRKDPIIDPSGLTSNVFSASNIGGTTWPTFYSYMVKPEPATGAESQYRAAIRVKAVRGDGTLNTLTTYGLCFAHPITGTGIGGARRKEWQTEFKRQWNSTTATLTTMYDQSTISVTQGTPTIVNGAYYWVTGELVRTGGTCRLTSKVYTDAGFNPLDYDAGTPIATVVQQSTTDATALAAGYCGFFCAGRFSTPWTGGGATAPDGDWEVTDFYTFLLVQDTNPPLLIGGSVDMDGRTLRARWGDSSLPLKTSGGGAITGLTFQARNGFTGSWTNVTTGTPVIDPQDGSQVKAIATTAIPMGWDVRAVYSSGNILDSNNNAASNGEIFLPNYSKVDPSLAVTWPKDILLSTDSWLRVSARTGSEGYEGQSVRNIKLPYGCGSSGIRIYFEGFSDRAEVITSLVVRILGAGVRAVQPDGTVSTHTLTFNSTGTGTTNIAFDQMDYATIAQAFPPGTDLYVTTWYKEASNGRLPWQWLEFIGQAYAGSDSYCNAHERGLVGSLTSKILLGGTSGGPPHSALAPTGGLPDARATTYGPAMIVGRPHPTYAGTPKPCLVFGNSMAIDSVIKPIAAYAWGDHKNPYTMEAFCTSGVGGALADSFLTSVVNNAPTQLLIGTTSANTLIARAVEIFGHNEVRSQGVLTSPAQEIPLLWQMRVNCANVFVNLGIRYLTTTITPIRNSYISWPSELREMVPKVIAAHNAELRFRWDTIPGVDGVIDFASTDGAPRNASRGVESEADPMAGYSNWYLNDELNSGDGIHGTPLNTAGRAAMMVAKFRELDAAASGGGGGGGGGTTALGSRQARRGRG